MQELNNAEKIIILFEKRVCFECNYPFNVRRLALLDDGEYMIIKLFRCPNCKTKLVIPFKKIDGKEVLQITRGN